MKLFYKKGDAKQEYNVRQFERLMQMNNDLLFEQPQPFLAPWHVQVRLGVHVLNIWPHLIKGNAEGERAVVGYDALQRLIGEARNGTEDIALIEDDD